MKLLAHARSISAALTMAAVTLVGCSRGATTAVRAEGRIPGNTPVRPTAAQVFNDAQFVPSADGTTWAPYHVNARLGAIRKGQTTRANLLRRFGYPTERQITSEGGEVWIYAAALAPRFGGGDPDAPRVQRVAIQRRLVMTFARNSTVVTEFRTYVTGERAARPFHDPGAPFPMLEPRIIPTPDAPGAPERALPDAAPPPALEARPIQPFFP